MSEETIPQMREQIDQLSKDLKATAAERDELVLSNHKLVARDAFRDEGYPASHGDLFASQNPEAKEISKENVNEFVAKFGLTSVEGEGSGKEGKEGSSDEGDLSSKEVSGSTDLAEMARGGSRPGDSADGASLESMTRQKWQELMTSDPAAAREAVRQGKVQISKDNPWGDSQPVAPGKNFYAPSEAASTD